jgi:transposase
MELFLLDEFDVSIPNSTISDALPRIGWSEKTARQKAKERNPDLGRKTKKRKILIADSYR